MTAAQIMDIISRLPCSMDKQQTQNQQKTQVKMEDVHKLLKIPKSECPDRNVQTVGFVYHDTNGLDHGAWKIQLFLFNGICMVTVHWECLFVHREKGLFLVDLGEPTSFFDHVCLGCTPRQYEISKDIVDNYRTMFES